MSVGTSRHESVVLGGGETDSGAWLARDLEPIAHDGSKAQNAVLNGQAGAADNNVFIHAKSVTSRSRSYHSLNFSPTW